MKIHKGEIIEMRVRNSGYTIKKVAEKMKISRSTLYKHFEQIDVSEDFISRLGKVIHHDFSKEFPNLKGYTHAKKAEEEAANYQAPIHIEFLALQKKYCELLESYSQLLKVVIKVCNISSPGNELSKIQKEIMIFVEKNPH